MSDRLFSPRFFIMFGIHHHGFRASFVFGAALATLAGPHFVFAERRLGFAALVPAPASGGRS